MLDVIFAHASGTLATQVHNNWLPGETNTLVGLYISVGPRVHTTNTADASCLSCFFYSFLLYLFEQTNW